MKKIKIKFVDFWETFNYKEFIIYKRLKKFYDVVVCDDPDYIFYSCFGYDNINYSNCIKIYFTGENIAPDFNMCDYAISSERLEFGERHFRLPIYYDYLPIGVLKSCKDKHKKIDENTLMKKTKFCSFVYSNIYANKERADLFNLICNYKNVDSAGRFLNNMPNGNRAGDIIEFQENYKFSIACENSKHLGYTTEKILNSFASKTIPIYWGDPRITETFNPKSFINVSDYKTDNDLIKRIKQIDNDDELYINMLKEPILNNENEFEIVINNLDKFLRNIFDNHGVKDYQRNRAFGCGRLEHDYKLVSNIRCKGYLYTLFKHFLKEGKK